MLRQNEMEWKRGGEEMEMVMKYLTEEDDE